MISSKINKKCSEIKHASEMIVFFPFVLMCVCAPKSCFGYRCGAYICKCHFPVMFTCYCVKMFVSIDSYCIVTMSGLTDETFEMIQHYSSKHLYTIYIVNYVNFQNITTKFLSVNIWIFCLLGFNDDVMSDITRHYLRAQTLGTEGHALIVSFPTISD